MLALSRPSSLFKLSRLPSQSLFIHVSTTVGVSRSKLNKHAQMKIVTNRFNTSNWDTQHQTRRTLSTTSSSSSPTTTPPPPPPKQTEKETEKKTEQEQTQENDNKVCSSSTSSSHSSSWINENMTTNDKIGAVLFSMLSAITAYLAYWQIQRRRWKIRVLADRQNQLDLPPIQINQILPQIASEPSLLSSFYFRPLHVSGTPITSRGCLVGPRRAPQSSHASSHSNDNSMTDVGNLVVQPFKLNDEKGTIVLVNRGWMPNNHDDDGETTDADGHFNFTGILREPEKRPQYLSSSSSRVTYVDVDLILKDLDLHIDYTPLIIDVISSSSLSSSLSPNGPGRGRVSLYPLRRDPRSLVNAYTMPEMHAVYAITWATLSVLTAALTQKRFKLFKL